MAKEDGQGEGKPKPSCKNHYVPQQTCVIRRRQIALALSGRAQFKIYMEGIQQALCTISSFNSRGSSLFSVVGFLWLHVRAAGVTQFAQYSLMGFDGV